MSSDVAIRVEGLGKAYTIRHQTNDHVTLAQVALERAKHPFRRNEREDFWALRDVSFEVKQGEVLGVIGRNGAGKSTLLKLLTRITGPTAGRIDLWGRVGSLLEVGTGFHPELTGRENVYLNGSILGMSRKEIDRQFDAIVDFAGVEKFLDTPVKRYSSGMYVRLAFAVAAHLETEILLVDEVLAVGDQEFQKKCLGKMHDVAVDGRTVLFVSHQLASITQLCDRAILLMDGALAFDGAVIEAADAYIGSIRTDRPQQRRRSPEAVLHIDDVVVVGDPDKATSPKGVRFTVTPTTEATAPYFVSAHIVDSKGTVIAQCDSRLIGLWLEPSETHVVTLRMVQPWLLPGEYRVDLFACSPGIVDAVEGAAHFRVGPSIPFPGDNIQEALASSTVLPDFSYVSQTIDPLPRPTSARSGS
ncbi:MAG: polysaccharide ABC transporter ATP-binding protein [Acidimicrobiales bacterium]|jgi:lipopolysaccharide transport system ATP-binding protein|nr:polysaccharide ABC transporter ATP-binding protein [Acidimicrobiales bacterium]